MPSENIEAFRQMLRASKNILVLTGAGLSAASGIPTFRGDDGKLQLWRKFDPTELATPHAWAENQSRVWQFYHYRRELVLKAKPNPAHYALARLAIPSIRYKVAPESRLTHVTQNVDGFLAKALHETVLASASDPKVSAPETEQLSEIIEMHGRLFDVKCTAHDCQHVETNYNSPVCPALAGTEVDLEDETIPERVVRRADLPRCTKCGSLCRPDVVWFGEVPHRMREIMALADQADLCIVVGTSAVVQPAAQLGGRVKAHGGKVAVFNLEVGNHANEADFLFPGPCEERLQEVFQL